MSDVVIKVQNLSKQYRLGIIGTGTISDDINRWWHRLKGKEDPYLKIGDINDRTTKGNSEYVWALRDINFEVHQGDILGIIGRNGAGKSTLLKILSKTTVPTVGQVGIKGRVASLLEVGTGFHPELSGRDNIYLNGAILGMTKRETRNKFDEIVDFSGIERYIDTPVKRYSSGMYVRLAFAVAAFLEPEILIVDEVLAVGDAEFQKKCLGKMEDINSKDGRTVLFVSHNMSAITRFCKQGIYIKNGTIQETGLIDQVINTYMGSDDRKKTVSKSGIGGVEVLDIKIKNAHYEEVDTLHVFEDAHFEMEIQASKDFRNVDVALCFNSLLDIRITSLYTEWKGQKFNLREGRNKLSFFVKGLRIIPGEYKIVTYIASNGIELESTEDFRKLIISINPNSPLSSEPKSTQGVYFEDYVIDINN
jgi:lipopolysaccharide transport system ATP-binding protein